MPFEFHKQLIEAMEVRHAGDYQGPRTVSAEEAAEQIARAEKFIELAARMIGPVPEAEPKNS